MASHSLELNSGRPVVSWQLDGERGQVLVKNSRVDNGSPVKITLTMTNDRIYLSAGTHQNSSDLIRFKYPNPATLHIGGHPKIRYFDNHVAEQ